MGEITLSSAVRQNLLSLQSTADLLSTTQSRLATGKKVNSALDNPTNYFTAAGLDNRASDISKLMDSIGSGIQTLKAADAGIKSLTKLVDSAKATARQALQAPNAYTNKATVTSNASGLTADDLTGVIAGTGVNATTGTGTVAVDITSTPDKVASYQLATIGDDTAATTGAGSDLSTTGNASGSTAINDTTDLDASYRFAAGDTLTISGVNGTKTLNITTAATGTSDANNIKADDTIANLQSKLTNLLKEATGDTSASFTYNATSDQWTASLSDNAKDFTLGGNVSKLGLSAATYTPTNTDLLKTTGKTMTTGTGAATALGTDLLSAVDGSITASDTITFTGSGGTQTFTFNAAGGTSNATNAALDDTVSTLATKFQALIRTASGDTGATVSFSSGKMSIQMTDNTKTLQIAGNNSARAASALGFSQGEQTLVAGKGSMAISVGDNTAKTLYFGTGTGQIQNRRDLMSQLSGVTGLSASLNDTTNTITLKNANGEDLKSAINLTASNASALGSLGIAAGNATTTNGKTAVSGNSATISATNLLTQVSGLSGQSLTVAVGNDTKTFTFGTGKDQISTYSELQAALVGQGAALSKDAGNKLSVATSSTNISKQLTIQGNAAATLGINTGTFSGSGQTLSGTSLSLTSGTGAAAKTANFTFGSGAGQIKTLDQLNAKLTSEDVGVQASLSSDGKLQFTTTNENARGSFKISGTAANKGFGAASAFHDVESSTASFGGTGDTQRRNLVKDYNDLLGQIDKLADDSSFNGINLLKGDDLKIIFNENNTSSVKIKGVTFNSEGMGLTSLKDDGSDFLDADSINKVLSKLDTASNTLRSQSSKFGSNLSVVQTRQDFSKEMINVLQTGSANLTLADTNEEAANSTALQTRQQLSVAALGLANQAGQAALRLIG